MRQYACYPGSRAGFRPMRSAFHAPNVSFATSTEMKDTRPSANIIRKSDSYEIQLAVPGLNKDQVRIEVNGDQLIVAAVDVSKETAETKFLRHDYDYTGFKRIFRLHKNANSAALKASFDQGILTIVIPDKEPETIKIDIQ